MPKTPHFGSFCPFLSKTELSSKFCSDQFFLILTKYHCAKYIYKKQTNEPIQSNTGFRRTHTHGGKEGQA